MTTIRYTGNYETQDQLRRAYERLGHTPPPAPAWSATLVIDHNLCMSWACPKLLAEEFRLEDRPAGYEWHVIAQAGELDWPPLRPEEEIWPALLEQHPVPTGERTEEQSRMYGGGNVEDWHYKRLRDIYFGDAHIRGRKRNASDVNFSPLVRDWDATARELADFLNTHRPPKLTTEQRVMAQGVHLAELQVQVEHTKTSLGRLMRNAARAQRQPDGRLPHGFQSNMSRWGGMARTTVVAWLADGGHCEGAVPDEPEDDTDTGQNVEQ
ncbi:hypothetical protein [Streptomyces sp. NRRL S-1868]|uniref:hypothetical protein n=1 Tax=Streptomyces sp. NRRL S-1868 TaxID=1463892 RepID=UPI000A5852E4|nr:hypothetical protein [Streptomyces sp. NRRL S-1868]